MAGNEQQGIVKSFSQELERMKPQIQAALPKHLNADRMARIALTEFRRNPKLGECHPKSVFAAIIMASQLGLEPGVMGQCYLIPYGGECTFVPGWQGFVDLVSRTGRASVWTGAVFQGDEFEYQYGDRPFVHHKPCGEEDPKKLTHAYAVGRVNGSDWPVIEVWPAARIWKHRDRFNKVGNKHYSHAHPEMYARKVVLLQVIKYMPKSVEITVAANLEAAANDGKQGITIEAAVEKTYEAPDPANPQETDEDRQLRESCEEMLRKQGFNQAQMEAKISQNRGSLKEFHANLQKNLNTKGGSNGSAQANVADARNRNTRAAVAEMDVRDAGEAEEPPHEEHQSSEDTGAEETNGEREEQRDKLTAMPRSTAGKRQTKIDWSV